MRPMRTIVIRIVRNERDEKLDDLYKLSSCMFHFGDRVFQNLFLKPSSFSAIFVAKREIVFFL